MVGFGWRKKNGETLRGIEESDIASLQVYDEQSKSSRNGGIAL
jgi:hypothetical protein